MRSGASPGTGWSSVTLFVVRSIRISRRSRWLITQPLLPEKAMLAGPSPTAIRRSTLPLAGATRSTCAAWSSATHTEPPPIQTLYAALAPTMPPRDARCLRVDAVQRRRRVDRPDRAEAALDGDHRRVETHRLRRASRSPCSRARRATAPCRRPTRCCRRARASSSARTGRPRRTPSPSSRPAPSPRPRPTRWRRAARPR